MEKAFLIFTDSSFDPLSGRGVAGMLVKEAPLVYPIVSNLSEVQTRKYANTSSTRLEIEAVLWALGEMSSYSQARVHLYTDSKTVVDLGARRTRLEKASFMSKATGKVLGNGDLYKKFFKLFDLIHPQLTWVKGHQPSHRQNEIEQLFALVDKKTRQVLRDGRNP